MTAEQLLNEIADYCRRVGMAESTFGRRAVNDGKLVSRLRIGGRVTMETVERVRTFMTDHATLETRGMVRLRSSTGSLNASPVATAGATVSLPRTEEAKNNFRFYDNRQKYLLFVNTCSEKWVVAQRVGMELANIHPRPPALLWHYLPPRSTRRLILRSPDSSRGWSTASLASRSCARPGSISTWCGL